MTIKKKITIFISVFFSLILGVTFLIIYWKSTQVRKEEFKTLLEEKANSTVKILVELKVNDSRLIKAFSKNTIHKLLDEKTLVFNKENDLIYSSLDDAVIKWSESDLKLLKSKKTFYRIQNQYEVYGYYYSSNGEGYSVLVMAEDVNGRNRLQSLAYLFLFAFFFSAVTIIISTNYIVDSLLKPLNIFIKQITAISDKNLTERLQESTGVKDEINLLVHGFNQMMGRIEVSYKKQQEFSASASHELRTPLARMISQLENLQQNPNLDEITSQYLTNIKADTVQMAELVHSLLLLSQIHQNSDMFQNVRIDEALFDVMQQISTQNIEVSLQFNFIENEAIQDYKLDIQGNEALLKIAFSNLIKNAIKYGYGSWVQIEIEPMNEQRVLVRFKNDGAVLDETEQLSLYQAFMRGKNAKGKLGTGLGLRITQRILAFHNAKIEYKIQEGLNVFEIRF